MRCHYEVLEVARDADEGQIKAAYRRLALRWHPDKNLDSADAAKREFQLVQQAYEVLSDRQERAWYDNHREQILRGKRSDFQDNCVDVFQYCTPSCFAGYSDDESGGFYAVYRRVFEDITKEEMEFFDDKDEFCSVPMFGTSTSDYDATVKPFYDYWSSFGTRKSYAWLSAYDISEARGKMLKLIERENKKVQGKAKQERNDEVRLLVAFVRKRDRRVKENAKRMEERARENRAKQEQLSKQKRLERLRQLDESKAEQPEWARFDNVQSQLSAIEKSWAEEFGEQLSGDDDASEEEDSYCVACNKVFRTQKAFENHESSKKHKDNAERLKAIMIEEEEGEEDVEAEAQDEVADLLSDKSAEDEEEEVIKQKKKKGRKNVLKHKSSSSDDDRDVFVEVLLSDDDLDFATSSAKKQKRKSRKPKNAEPTPTAQTSNTESPATANGTESAAQIAPDAGKEKARKSNRGGKKEVERPASRDADVQHLCVTCKADFPSKNKLFDHLKRTGHQVFLPSAKTAKSKNKCVIK